ncbi:ribosomal large subunit pseudouridine synthase B [Dysgonomonas sp. Marseille-P4677]|nr:ribosomal large subunit pseudouridine synthase B [Dysgonomonas sp. Marseille-P4677]
MYYQNLKYSTKEINANFKIKVSGESNGRKVHKLVGVSGLVDLVGDNDLVNTLLKKAFNKGLDKVEHKLRRGLKVTFYAC